MTPAAASIVEPEVSQKLGLAERLIMTATNAFGQQGYNGVSTRAIATAADTAMSAITYHFGSKHGLYLAVADHIATKVAHSQASVVGLALAKATAATADAIEACIDVLDGLAMMMLDESTTVWARFLNRELLEPTEAFDRMWNGALQQLWGTVHALVKRARADLNDREQRALVVLLLGQAIMLKTGTAAICRFFQINQIEEGDASLLRAALRRNALLMLRADPKD